MAKKNKKNLDLLAETIARWRTLRDDAGMTQAAIVTRSGLTQSHVSEILAGRRDPSASTLSRLAAAMGCTGLAWGPLDTPKRVARFKK